jgi:cytochrome P450
VTMLPSAEIGQNDGEIIIISRSTQPLDHYDFVDPAVIEDPYPFYAALLREAPVYPVPGTELFLVSSWALIHEVLANQADYSANLTGVLIKGADGKPELFDLSAFGGTVDAIANADEPSHSLHRRMVLPQLTARKVGVLEEEVRHWAHSGVALLCDQGGGDCVATLANDIPVMVTARLIGLPVEDMESLLSWAFSGGEILAGVHDLEGMAALGTATGQMSAYLTEHLSRAVAKKLTDAPTDILGELAQGVQQGLINEREAVGILVVLVGAAGESTSSLIGSAIRLLAQDEKLQQELRQQPQKIAAYVEEVVRLESPFKGHYRAVLQDTELGGMRIARHSKVFLLWSAANRDPAVFREPNQLELGRADGSEHLGFGHGIHFCIGARLARMEVRIVLQALLAGTSCFSIEAGSAISHLQSIFVRRLGRLGLEVTPA